MTKRPAGEAETKDYAHTLSLRLTAEQYNILRRYALHESERTGERVTHQEIIVTALTKYLAQKMK